MARILVIEDNPANLELMTYLLVASGHAVDAATTGESGIELAVQAPPDLILLDIQLPDISGFGVLATLRNEARVASVPIVAVTANAMVGDRDQALAVGFDGYFSKPIEPTSFMPAIDGFLTPDQRGRRPQSPWVDGS